MFKRFYFPFFSLLFFCCCRRTLGELRQRTKTHEMKIQEMITWMYAISKGWVFRLRLFCRGVKWGSCVRFASHHPIYRMDKMNKFIKEDMTLKQIIRPSFECVSKRRRFAIAIRSIAAESSSSVSRQVRCQSRQPAEGKGEKRWFVAERNLWPIRSEDRERERKNKRCYRLTRN